MLLCFAFVACQVTQLHIDCVLEELDLSVEEDVLSAVHRYAAEHNSSVNALVREFLGSIAEREDRARKARARIRELSESSGARIGSKSWTRDEPHAR